MESNVDTRCEVAKWLDLVVLIDTSVRRQICCMHHPVAT